MIGFNSKIEETVDTIKDEDNAAHLLESEKRTIVRKHETPHHHLIEVFSFFTNQPTNVLKIQVRNKETNHIDEICKKVCFQNSSITLNNKEITHEEMMNYLRFKK